MDYADISKAFKPIWEKLDHFYLNELPGLENPTSENIAIWIWKKLKSKLPLLTEVVVAEVAAKIDDADDDVRSVQARISVSIVTGGGVERLRITTDRRHRVERLRSHAGESDGYVALLAYRGRGDVGVIGAGWINIRTGNAEDDIE